MIQVHTQFSVFLVNKPGVLAQVTRALADSKVNLVAMTLVDSQEHGVLRFVAEDPAKAREVVKKLNHPATETEVLGIVISSGSRAESEPRFSAYVWSAGPESETESTTKAA